MCDRDVIVSGLDDEERFSLGGDVGLVDAVMKTGKHRDALTAELVLTGEELVAFVHKHCLSAFAHQYVEMVEETVKPQNRYEVTAFDW